MNSFKRKIIPQTHISTASLPDIVFLLLFFFMVTAVIRTDQELLKYEIPKARHPSKVEMKTLVRELQVGVPKNPAFGLEPIISDGHRFLATADLVQWVEQQRSSMPEAHQDQMIIVIKADEAVEMGSISDIQQELRKANARKVLYRSKDKDTP